MKKLINQQPGRLPRLLLGIVPFLILLAVYLWASDARLAINPNDKLLPSVHSIGQAIDRLAFTPSKRTGRFLFWDDTFASLARLLMGVGISGAIALVMGIATGALPLLRAGLAPAVTAISLIPPMAVLPILFIVFGLGELSKVVLIIVGITPFMARDLQQRVLEIPREQIVKAQTLGANTWQIIVRVILPQILPRLFNALRLALGTAWLFLIAAEAIAATEGLGYRIFLVRRYLAMDVIIPYVLWITILAFCLDALLKIATKSLFPWFVQTTQPGTGAT
ncbi:MAG: ABC transporter permease [Burkholderiaceae bacterium]